MKDEWTTYGADTEPRRKQITRRVFVLAGSAAVAAAALKLRSGIDIVEAKSGSPKEVRIVEFSNTAQRGDAVTVSVMVKSDAEWKQQLSPVAFDVTRRAGTERTYSGQDWNLHEQGPYLCICCDTTLFNSETKFESGTGWPSSGSPSPKKTSTKAWTYH